MGPLCLRFQCRPWPLTCMPIKLPQAPIELMLRSGIDYRPGMARYYAEQYLSPAYASSRAQIRRQTATA